MTLFWASLGFMIVAFIVGAAVLVLRGLQMKKALKGLRGALNLELQKVSLAGERTNEQLESAKKKFELLNGSLKRFSTAQAQLRLINEALGEAEAFVTRARAFIPSK
ncbi:MAG TPA: hypothetical protein VII83_05480 [Gaiellaceae bacterium]